MKRFPPCLRRLLPSNLFSETFVKSEYIKYQIYMYSDEYISKSSAITLAGQPQPAFKKNTNPANSDTIQDKKHKHLLHIPKVACPPQLLPGTFTPPGFVCSQNSTPPYFAVRYPRKYWQSRHMEKPLKMCREKKNPNKFENVKLNSGHHQLRHKVVCDTDNHQDRIGLQRISQCHRLSICLDPNPNYSEMSRLVCR